MHKHRSFHIGDKVKLINDSLSGIITFIDKQLISIISEEGFTYTFNKNELIPKKDIELSVLNKSFDLVDEGKDSNNSSTKTKLSSKIKKVNPVLEVDLHIHQLIDSEKGMTNYDMLNLQLQTARKKLENAIQKKLKRIVFIHGIGEGVLKKELHQMLEKYNVEIFEASYKKYGQGATEVYIY